MIILTEKQGVKCNLLDIFDANMILVTTWPNRGGWASIIGIDSIIPYIIYRLDQGTEER